MLWERTRVLPRLLGRNLQRQRQVKRRTDLRPAFDLDAAAHELCELAANRKAESGATKTARSRLIRLGERIEDLPQGRRVHTDAGIGNRQLNGRPIRLVMYVVLDSNLTKRCELDGITDEIHQDLAHPQRVAEQLPLLTRRRAHDQIDALGLGGAREETRTFL